MNVLASRYGRELHGRKPISKFMTRRVLIVDKATPLEKVSKYLTNAVDHYMDEFIITDQGKCVGRGTLIDLLRRITDQQIYTARYANPLTLLPGNVLIHKQLDQLLEEGASFVAAYCDVDHFKPFNDVYGYALGDDIIRCLAGLLEDSAGEDDFVGHVGGDDFIVLFKSADWRERCRRLLEQFEERIPLFYNPRDRENGGIETEDRFGIKRHFPFMALSLGLVRVDPAQGWTKERFAEKVAEAKRQAKKLEATPVIWWTRRVRRRPALSAGRPKMQLVQQRQHDFDDDERHDVPLHPVSLAVVDQVQIGFGDTPEQVQFAR